MIRIRVNPQSLSNSFRRARLAALSRRRSQNRKKGTIQIFTPFNRRNQEQFIQNALRKRPLPVLNKWRQILGTLDSASTGISLTYTDNINQIVEDNPSWIQRGSDFIEGGINLIANILQDIQNVRNFLDDNIDVLDDLGLDGIANGFISAVDTVGGILQDGTQFVSDFFDEGTDLDQVDTNTITNAQQQIPPQPIVTPPLRPVNNKNKSKNPLQAQKQPMKQELKASDIHSPFNSKRQKFYIF